MGLDVESMLAEISPDAPCGADLEYDPVTLQLEQEFSKGTTEGNIVDADDGDDEEPSWSDCRSMCRDLLGRTRDLRLIIKLTVAEMMTDGPTGARDGVRLLKETIERHWDHVYPQLDPDDDNDPLERVNAISAMVAPRSVKEDPIKFRDRLAEMPLAKSRALGIASARFAQKVESYSAGDEEGDQKRKQLNAIIQDADLDEMQEAGEAVTALVEEIRGVDAALTEKVGAGASINFNDLIAEAEHMKTRLDGWLKTRGVGTEPEPGEEMIGEDGQVVQAAGGNGAVMMQAGPPGQVRTIEDVKDALNKVVDYYQEHEPSSPVAMIVQVASCLAGKGFLDIAQAMTPEAVSTLVEIRKTVTGEGDDD
ncbi:MAG: type VI secretion system protein TssA [Planctomycetota bacterium]